MTAFDTAGERNKLSAWVQTYSGCNPCHMANVREASPKALGYWRNAIVIRTYTSGK